MATTVGTLGGLWRYPVKSMRGEPLTAASLDARGLHGDRAYGLVNPETSKVGSAKHPRLWGRLLACRAEGTGAGDVRITLPDGQVVLAGTEEADAVLSALLGHRVALRDEPPATPEIERYWPDVEGMDLRDTLTSGRIGGGAPPGTFFDFAPVHLLTTAALAWLRALCPDSSVVAVQRFRPNLVIETPQGVEGCVEDGWVGRTLQIGQQVRLRVLTPTPRCVVPTLPQGNPAQGELPHQIEILRAIAAHHRPPVPLRGGAKQPSLGVYAVVEQGGTIQRDDEVRLLDLD